MIKIATCQYEIQNLNNWDEFTKKIKKIVLSLKKEGVQLLLLPEYAGTEIAGYHFSDEKLYATLKSLIPQYCSFFKELASEAQMYIQPGTILVEASTNQYFNRAYFFAPNGNYGYQDKLHLTQYEKYSRLIVKGQSQTLFETALGKIAIAICYDCEFPEIIRRYVAAGAWLILVPSYTTSLAGYHRVFFSSRARALENQCYVATSFVVGPVALTDTENTIGKASILGPVDDGFPDDGILAISSQEGFSIVTAELLPEKLDWVRRKGQVHNYEDARSYYDLLKGLMLKTQDL